MKIRQQNHIFIRHAGDENIVWCPRTGGCTVVRNAQPILDEITRGWRDVEEIVRIVAAKFDCGMDEVREGVGTVVGELTSQRFVDVDGVIVTGEIPVATVDARYIAHSANASYQDEDWTPLGDFYIRHGLPYELHIDLADGCNEKCVHCYLPHGGTHFLDKSLALKVVKEFRDAQGLTVYFSGGECMLHRDFAEILRYAKSLDLNIVVMSNLTLCDEKMVTLLKEIDPQFVNVSTTIP